MWIDSRDSPGGHGTFSKENLGGQFHLHDQWVREWWCLYLAQNVHLPSFVGCNIVQVQSKESDQIKSTQNSAGDSLDPRAEDDDGEEGEDDVEPTKIASDLKKYCPGVL